MKTFVCVGLFFFLSIALLSAQVNRTYSGQGNNILNPSWGKAKSNFRTFVSNGFSDSISLAGGEFRDNPRNISNALGSQTEFMPNEFGLSDFVWGWGQFIDHDINLGDDNLSESMDIQVPTGEPLFDPNFTGRMKMRMFRSISDTTSGKDKTNPRRFVNEITSFIDASAVYGSDETRARWLRTFADGKLKTSAGNLLPWNTVDGEFNSAVDSTVPFMVLDGHPKPVKFFIAGDVRANEQPGLACFHTLWVREHNRICDELKIKYPTWTDEHLYQQARKMVSGMIQSITYHEFLPSIGVQLSAYQGYNNQTNPSILNVFSAAGYRFGHTMVNGRLVRFEEDGDSLSFGAVDLRNGFFNPQILKNEGGVAPFFRGLAAQKHQFVDPLIMDDIRNFLFGPPGSGGLDLLSINIARARERGLPDYNQIRLDLGLSKHSSFNDLTTDSMLQAKLRQVYATVDDVDPWIGFMSEDHLPNAIMGEGLHALLKLQFENLRDGDRYYYKNDPSLTAAQITAIDSTTLAKVLLRNTDISHIQPNVFLALPRHLLSVELFPFPEVRNIQIKAYPNPVQKHFNLEITNSRASTALLTIIDAKGKIISSEEIKLKSGLNRYSFSLKDKIANGLYTIILKGENGSGELKIIKQE